MSAIRTAGTIAKFALISSAVVVAFCVLLVAVLAVKAWSWARE